MNAHTPGPWKVVRNHPYPKTAESYVEVFPETGGSLGAWSSQNICGLFCAEAGGIQEANATLIAAAPELLEALETALKYIELGAMNPRHARIIANAIAKAKGSL